MTLLLAVPYHAPIDATKAGRGRWGTLSMHFIPDAGTRLGPALRRPAIGGARHAPWLPVLVLLAVVAAPRVAHAKKVVAVKTSNIAAYNLALDGFRKAFGGEVVVQEIPRGAGLDDAAIARIRSQGPAAILAIGSKAAASLASRIHDVPIVYCMVFEPKKRHLDGANVTGVGLEIPAAEQLRQLKRVVPKLSKVGVVYDPAKTGPLVDTARSAAKKLGITLVEYKVDKTSEVPDAIDDVAGRSDALWLPPDATVVTHETFKHLLVVSLERKLPVLVFSVAFVKAGALLGVAPDYSAIGGVAAKLVDQILGGKKPSEIPMREPPSSIVINQTTAARIGVKLTPALERGTTLVK